MGTVSSRTPFSLWVLLLIGVSMSVAVAALGFAAWLQARQTAEAMETTRGRDLMAGVRRAVISSGKLDRQTLVAQLEAMTPSGVSFIGVLHRDGRPLTTVGKPVSSLGGAALPDLGDLPSLVRLDPTRVRIFDQLVPGQKAVDTQAAAKDCRGLGCMWQQTTTGHLLVIEFSPALELVTMARFDLLFRVGAATGAGGLVLCLLFGLLAVRTLRKRAAAGATPETDPAAGS